MSLMGTHILLCGCDLTHLPRAPPQVCAKAPAQQQYSSQNVREIEHCFIALGELWAGGAGALRPPLPRRSGRHSPGPPPAARSYPKELMKFFLRQMELSKEAICVGTLTLIRAVVGADGEQGQEGGWGAWEAGLTHVWTSVTSSFVDTTGWEGANALSCLTFSVLELHQHCGPPSPPQPSPQTLSPSSHLRLISNC